MLIQTNQLSHEQLTALDALCADCKNTDGNVVAIYRHLLGTNRGRPSNILCYQKPNSLSSKSAQLKMAGFLAAFFFDEEACEIALMVAPEFRRQDLATQMLNAILPLIRGEGIQRLIFSTPHELQDHWLTALGLHYQGSEFQMLRSENKPVPKQDTSASVRIATDLDIQTLCAIGKACFSAHRTDMPAHVHKLLHDPNHCLFIVSENGHVVGKAHLNWQPNGARLSDIAIIPRAQGRGLGSALLAHCINHALAANKSDLILDVETTNKQALRLYTRLGFYMVNAHDYWALDPITITF